MKKFIKEILRIAFVITVLLPVILGFIVGFVVLSLSAGYGAAIEFIEWISNES